MSKKISIYGIGNFGYAILKHLDNKNDQSISLYAYDRNSELIQNLQKTQSHLFFHKFVKISDKIKFIDNVGELIDNCDVLILAINSEATREVIHSIKNFIKKDIIILNTVKALDYKTGKRISKIVNEELEGINYVYALISGGTIASDLFSHEPL